MLSPHPVVVLAFLGVAGAGCSSGGGDDDSGGIDGGGGQIDGGGGVAGVAHVVQGATPPAPSSLQRREPGPAFATDGKWYVSPDQLRVHLTRVNFTGQTPETGTGADLVDCVVTYDRAAATLSALLDCPFEVAPGTYLGMLVFVDPVAEVLISDADNGLFTDPGAAGGLSSSLPAGGADFVPVTATLGGGFEQIFSSPLVIGADQPLSLSIVVDAIQSAEITVGGGGATLAFGDYFPAVVFPSVGAPGIPQYYTSAGTADSYNDSLVLANIVRVYNEPGADGQPAYAVFQQRAGELSSCTEPAGGIGAYPADPTQSEPNASGARTGGWLGRDSDDTLCWAYAADDTYATYTNYLTMPQVTAVGDSTVIRCEQTASPTPPSAGATYASGCPAMVSEHSSASLTLVAD